MKAKMILTVPILILAFLLMLETQLTPLVAEASDTAFTLTTPIQFGPYPDPSLFDPSEFHIIREPEGEGPGYWVDHPGIFLDEETGVFWLVYRWRKPVPEGRGHHICIANSTDGIHFTDVWSASKYEFPTPHWTLDGVSMLKDPKTGLFKLYISKGEPWQIFKLEDVQDPANFDPATTHLVLEKGAEGEWDEFHVANPWVRWIEDRFVMLYDAAGYVEGVQRERLGVAMSFDGETWEKNPNNPILDGGPRLWDTGVRFGPIWQYQDHWLVPYTGHRGWYRERDQWTGLAEWPSPPTWPYPKLTKLTVDGPFVTGMHPLYKTLKDLDCIPVQFPNGTSKAYFYYSTGTEEGSLELRVSVSRWIDSWPMFRHDPGHSGYSTSTAPNTNNTMWSYTTSGEVMSSPAVVDGRVYVGSEDRYVYCLNATTGALIWSYRTGGRVQSSPAVVDGKVYIGSWDRNVYALNATTGAFIWSYRTGYWVRSSPCVVGGVVYVGSWDRNVYALNATTGAFIWSYRTDSGVFSTPAVDGRVYVGSEDRYLYCLNATTGALIWSFPSPEHMMPSPCVVNGVVYVGHTWVYALNATTGALIWSYTTGAEVYSSPAVANGKVYVGSRDNKIYAFGDVTPPTTETSFTGTSGLNNWYVSDVTVSVIATDDASGVAITEYSLDGISWGRYTGSFMVSFEGTTTIYYCSADNVWNVEDIKTEALKIDTTPPETLTVLDPETPNGLNGWYTMPVRVTLTGSDETSGVAVTHCRINGGPQQVYNMPFTISDNGIYMIDFWSMDAAGNIETAKSVSFKIDQTPPTSTLTMGEPNHGTDPRHVSTTTNFSLEATDAMSDVDYTEYKVDSAPWAQYSASFNVLGFGSHTVYYRSIDVAGNVEDMQSTGVVVNATSVSYSGDTTGQYSDPVTVEATLIDMATQQSISGKSITFTIGSQSLNSVTDDEGVAAASVVLNQAAGTYTSSATFAGDECYLGSSEFQLFAIEKEDALVDYTGDTVVSTATKTINLRATVFDSSDGWWGDLTKIQVTFRIYTAPIDLNNPVAAVGPVSVTQTNMLGVGVAVAEIRDLSENGYIIIASVDADDNDFYRGPTSDPIPLTVYEPTGEFVTGGGWIWNPKGNKGNFGFNVKYTKSGKPQGHSTYVYRKGGWNYIVKSNAWIGLAIEEGHAYFEAKCVVQKYNRTTGELIWAEGNYQFRVDVWDNDSDEGVDIYQIRVLDKNGVLFHEAGFDPLGELQGGSIIIHDKRKKKA